VYRWALPGVWGFAAYITATNYLNAQKIVRPQVVTSAIVLAIHAPMNLLFIYTFGEQPTQSMYTILTRLLLAALNLDVAPFCALCCEPLGVSFGVCFRDI